MSLFHEIFFNFKQLPSLLVLAFSFSYRPFFSRTKDITDSQPRSSLLTSEFCAFTMFVQVCLILGVWPTVLAAVYVARQPRRLLSGHPLVGGV